jgi:hypothetical protein
MRPAIRERAHASALQLLCECGVPVPTSQSVAVSAFMLEIMYFASVCGMLQLNILHLTDVACIAQRPSVTVIPWQLACLVASCSPSTDKVCIGALEDPRFLIQEKHGACRAELHMALHHISNSTESVTGATCPEAARTVSHNALLPAG